MRRLRHLSALIVPMLLAGCAQPAGAAPGNVFRYTSSQAAWLEGNPSGRYSVLVPEQREIWIAPDGSGRLRSVPAAPIFFGVHDRAEWGARPTDPPKDEQMAAGALWYEDLSAVPTNAADLQAAILKKLRETSPAGASTDKGILDAARDMLKETVPPVAISRAVFDMLLAVPGIEHHPAKDRAGRPGVAFSLDTTGQISIRLTLILDRDRGMLGEEEALLTAQDLIDAPPPVVIDYVTYLHEGLVGTTDEVAR